MSTMGPEPVDLRPAAEELVAAAGRAPSPHNAQPWAFRVGRDSVEVHFDDRRSCAAGRRPSGSPLGRPSGPLPPPAPRRPPAELLLPDRT